MKMSKKIRRLVGLTVCLLLVMVQANAQRIVFDGEKFPLQIMNPAVKAEEGEEVQPQKVNVSELQVFGRNADGKIVVLCNGNIAGYADESALADLDMLLDLSSIGEWTYPETIARYMEVEGVDHFQELLNSLNYDVGTADGIFGGKTENGITQYQTDMGLEVNGTLDLVTQLSLEGSAETETIETTYPISFDAAQLYKAIYGKVRENLQAFADAGWRLSYDEFDGRGEINARTQLGGYEKDTSQADRLKLTSKLIVRIEDVLTDAPRMYPALCLTSKGASSVYMHSVDIKRGSDVATLELMDSTRRLDGLELYEEAFFRITDEALQIMSDADKGELSVRLNCQNAKYILVGADNDKAIEAFCNVCRDAGF